MLTKDDLKGIREVVSEALESSFPRLFEEAFTPFAAAIQEDFKEVKSGLVGVKKEMGEGFVKIHDDISYAHNQLASIEEKMDKKADQEAVRSLQDKVIQLETKMK